MELSELFTLWTVFFVFIVQICSVATSSKMSQKNSLRSEATRSQQRKRAIASITTTSYTSPGALFTALAGATPGSSLILADGNYVYDAKIIWSVSNVTIKSKTPGGVILTTTSTTSSGFNLQIQGSNNIFSGFQFIGAHSLSLGQGTMIEVTGSNNTLSQLNFDACFSSTSIAINAPSKYNVITLSNFQNKPVKSPTGEMISVYPGKR